MISSITAQSSTGVSSSHPIDPIVLKAQLRAILADSRPDAVKIGMLGGAQQVAAVSSAIERNKLKNVVLDPVLASTSGSPLIDTAGRYLLLTVLLPLCDIVTPNLAEAGALTGTFVRDQQSMLRAGDLLLSLGARAVLVKGGHLPGEPYDWFLQRNVLPIKIPGKRIDTAATHGTGCLLSSAIAGYLARGEDVVDAVFLAKEHLSKALANPIVVGRGRGYPNPLPIKDHRSAEPSSRTHAELVSMLRGIYVITDRAAQNGRSYEEVVQAALDGGASIIQLRDKSTDTASLIAVAKRLNGLVRSYNRLFIINDRVDIALAADADGVHLGPDDMHPQDARLLLGPDKLIGVSTGTVDEASGAAPFASYLGVGCVFGSQTKTDAGEPVGTERILHIKKAVSSLPIVAIGGIAHENLPEIVAAGVNAAAMISAVVGSDDIQAATSKAVKIFS